MRLLLGCWALALAQPLHGQHDDRIAGLASPPGIFLGEGLTDAAFHPRATGTLRAIMLFARFPDGTEDRTPRELYDHLAPGATAFFKASSYGRFDLQIEARYRWYPLRGRSTDPGYDCSRYESHRAYVAEVIAAADPDVDFRPFAVVYVVATKNKGTPISPTLHCGRGRGILADGNEIRHAVTFGNDCRGTTWGWQTLVHETGHILGLPDLYRHDPVKGDRKSAHAFVGCWDPMGHQGHGPDFLAWHKLKCSWLQDRHVAVVTAGSHTQGIAPIGTERGVKAVVVPVSDDEAYVAEVKGLDAPLDEPGVLIYKVSTRTPSGRGPIRVVPAAPDDDAKHPALARDYITLYKALYGERGRFEDEAHRVRIDVLERTREGYRVRVTR